MLVCVKIFRMQGSCFAARRCQTGMLKVQGGCGPGVGVPSYFAARDTDQGLWHAQVEEAQQRARELLEQRREREAQLVHTTQQADEAQCRLKQVCRHVLTGACLVTMGVWTGREFVSFRPAINLFQQGVPQYMDLFGTSLRR